MQIGTIIYGILFMVLIYTGSSIFMSGVAASYNESVNTSIPAIDSSYTNMNKTLQSINSQISETTTATDPLTGLWNGMNALTNTLKLFAYDIPTTVSSLVDGLGAWIGIDAMILNILKMIVLAIIVIAVVEAVRRWYLQ